MKTNRFITYLILLLIVMISYGQIPPSPGSAGLIRDINTPVNHYSGIPQINVPLYNLPHHNGHSIPINLSYHAGGHKVQDVAGPVGLGWRLQAGGRITRIVRGKPDNGTIASPTDLNGWNSQFGLPDHPNPNFHGLNDDTEYDLFFFSIPGRTGKFIVKTNGTVLTTPHQDIKIEKTGDLDNAKWQITDELGNRYYFNWNGGEYERTRSNTSQADGTYNQNENVEFVSTWFLTEIDYYNSPEDVTFSYATKGDYTYFMYNNVATVNWNTCSGVISDDNYTADTRITMLSPKVLSSIVTLKGHINFQWSDGRLDIGSGFLEKLIINDKSGANVRNFDFEYSYSDSDDARWSNNIPYGCDNGAPFDDRFRLMLDKIQMDGIQYREFKYKHGESFDLAFDCFGESQQVDLYQLPPRSSFYVDHWGYSSYQSFGGNPWYARFTKTVKKTYTLIDGHNRTPSLDGSLANMLYQMIYPTGGYTEFEYELNQGTKYNQSTVESIGGLRVKSISQYQGGSLTTKTDYSYQNGVYREKPIHYYGIHTPASGSRIVSNDYYNFGSACFDVASVTSSYSFNSLFDLNGIHIEYPKVTETRAGFGSVEYEYHTSAEQNGVEDELPVVETFSTGTISYLNSNEFGVPFVPFTTNFWKRGLLKKKSYFEVGIAHAVSTESYFYNTFLTGQEVSSKRPFRVPNMGYVVQTYANKVGVQAISKIENRVFSRTNASQFALTVRDINYFGNAFFTNVNFPSEVITTYPDGSQEKSKVLYTFDLAQGTEPTTPGQYADAIWELWNDNAIGTRVESINLFKESGGSFEVLSGSLTRFGINATLGAALPETTYGFTATAPLGSFTYSSLDVDGRTFLLDSHYEPITTITIDSNGDITQEVGHIDGQTTDYTFDARGYLINASYDQNRDVSYTYEQLVGVKTQTDINNKTIQYEYDNQNRLHLIRDQDNNIVERYRYNYAGEGDLTANLVIDYHSDGQLEDRQHTFQLENVECYGDCSIYWDWGDGTTEQGGETMTHTWIEPNTSPGYEIIVTIVSPEYDEPLNIKRTITLQDDVLTATIVPTWHPKGAFEGYTHTFNLNNIHCPNGGCTYTWNWDDNSPLEQGTSLTHVYDNWDAYTIAVTIENTTYNESNTVYYNANILNFTPWVISVDGPTSTCADDPPNQIYFTADTNNGDFFCLAANWTYTWYLKIHPDSGGPAQGGFVQFDTGTSAHFPPGNGLTPKKFIIQLIVNDGCPREDTVTFDFTVSDCGGGGGGPGSGCTGTCTSLSSTPATYTFGENGGSQGFSISKFGTNVEWKVASKPSWVTTSPAKDVCSDGTSLNVSVGSYSGTNNRSGFVEIIGNGCSRLISISQEGISNPCPTGCHYVAGQGCMSDSNPQLACPN